MDRRRFLLTSLAGALAAPLAAEAQQPGRVPVVGVLNSGAGPRSGTVDTTRQGLRDLGYVEGQTIAFDVRFAGITNPSTAFPTAGASTSSHAEPGRAQPNELPRGTSGW